MRIATNTVSESIVRQIQQLAVQQSRLQTQVATGQRIDQPSDDPPAAGRVLNHHSTARRAVQYLRNADRALELSQSSFASLNQVKKISDRAGELGTLGQGATSPEARRAYAAEVNQLVEQLLQLGNAKLGSDHLFAGTAIDQPPYTATRDVAGRITSVAYAGNSSPMEIQLSETASLSPLTSGATNQAVGGFINDLVALRDALEAGDSTALSTVQADLIASEDMLVSALAEHGAVQMRIEVNRAQQVASVETVFGLISSETTADLPQTIVRLNQSQTAYQAALQSAANIMQISLLDYIR
jgi:flagellar hook-associated protein 3 FlgL